MTRVIQTVTVTLPAFMLIIVGVFGGEWSKNLWPAWIWLLITVVALVGTFVFGVTRRAYVLEREREPKVSISDPQDDFVPWNEARDGGRVRHYYSVLISNLSTEQIMNCSVLDHRFTNVQEHTAPASGRRYMRLRSEREADPGHHKFTRVFNLRGMGESVGIDICSMDEGEENSRVHMHYATGPTEQLGNAIVRELFPHRLTLRVTADNLAEPVDKAFKIYISDDGDLRMVRI